MEELLRAGLMESWQSELQQLLQNLAVSERGGRSANQRRKLHFQLQNCIDVCQEMNRVSFMALPSNVILNIPITASLVAEAPLNSDRPDFDIEVLTLTPGEAQSTVVIGCVHKGFKSGVEPGKIEKSIGYRPSDGSVYKDGVLVFGPVSGATCVQGDKLSCGIERKDNDELLVYFTKNDEKICEVVVDNAVDWFPAVTMSGLKEEVRLLKEPPWRSIKASSEPHGGMKMCPETGHVSFRSNKPEGARKDALMLASQPFSRHFSFFEIEIIALGEKDEVSLGAVPEDYPKRLPGFRPRSVGFHGRVGGIYGGRESKCDGAPKCVVGDKMGCGVEHRSNGKRVIFFTHNSKSFMEAELNDNCPDRLFPAIGLRAEGTGTVSACIMDPSNWLSADDVSAKHAQVTMETEVSSELGEVVVDRETARASYTAEVDVVKDAILVASTPFTAEKSYFEIEILYGSLITVGLVPVTDDTQPSIARHPGFTEVSIGYNAETGKVYGNGKALKDVGKSTYGERVGFGAKTDDDGQRIVYFKKNGNIIYEAPFGNDPVDKLCPAIGMRSAGQVLAIRLLDRAMWACQTIDEPTAGEDGSMPSAMQQLIDRELIECPICRDVFTDPRILPCSIHTFCAACIQSYVGMHGGRRSMPCPVCRSVFTLPPGGVSDLPVNSIVTRLLELRNKFQNSSVAGASASGATGGNEEKN